jgi:acyl dehydratase
VTFTRDELPEGRTDWDRLRTMTDEEVEQAAAADPDCPPLSQDELAAAQLVWRQPAARSSPGDVSESS